MRPVATTATAVAVLLTALAACATPPGAAHTDPQPAPSRAPEAPRIQWGLVLHGGAGTLRPGSMSPELERQYRATMAEALRAGHAVLGDGGSSVDAVIAAVVILEDSPLFNAGRGAVFTAEGRNELDASIMDGSTLRAGAVAGVTRVRNPIRLARLVMDASAHVMLAREGAEEFARAHGVELIDPAWFRTEMRWQQLEAARDRERRIPDESPPDQGAGPIGTVGIVAIDRQGRLAAGTSTGGMTNKRWGRIGDSPLIGAGNYADDRCGVSATGWGEFFIRNVVAHDICARARYLGIPLERAALDVVMQRLAAQEPDTGGVIALDRDGHVVMVFNTTGMYRGWIDQDGRVETAIYRD